MRILFLAPEPFFQIRGTPFAIRLALEVLGRRPNTSIDLITYHEGTDVEIPNVTIHRMAAPKFLKGVAAGVSIKKIIYDLFFIVSVFRIFMKLGPKNFTHVHAVEESVFIAWVIKKIWGIPYVYDMDSSMALQITERWTWAKPFQSILNWFEGFAIKNSTDVVPICDALAAVAIAHGIKEPIVLTDFSLLDVDFLKNRGEQVIPLREELKLEPDSSIILYTGNLEQYQGVDLLLQSFAQLNSKMLKAHLVIMGGIESHISNYRKKSEALGCAERVHFTGPRPIEHMEAYMKESTILAAPRIDGNNTPMKIYTYLHSGVPMVATRIESHTQVLDDRVAVLVDPTVEGYAAGLEFALSEPEVRRSVGVAAHALAEEKFTFPVFVEKLNKIYDRLGTITSLGIVNSPYTENKSETDRLVSSASTGKFFKLK